MLQKSPYEIADFSGGINDFIYDPNNSRSEILDNFLINKENRIETRPGSSFDVTGNTAFINANAQIPSGAVYVGNLINYRDDKLLVRASGNIYYRAAGVYTNILGPSGGPALISANTASEVCHSTWNDQVFVTHDAENDMDGGFGIPMKIFENDSGVMKVVNAGLPEVPAGIALGGAGGANNYLYAFTYSYEYTVLEQTFITESSPQIIEKPLILEPSAFSVSMSFIADLPGQNYDTANIKKNIYRTVNNGTLFYRVTQLANGVTTYFDATSDATLQANGVQLYINDGTVDHDQPPKCKFVHVVNGTGYYGFIEEGTDQFPYLIRQSIPNIPDAVPLEFELTAEQQLKGISSATSIPIILCTKHIYRIEAAWDKFGRGTPRLVRISDHAGCLSVNSCVQAEGKLFWAGNDGFYSTDGYTVLKISDGFNEFYKSFLPQMTDKRQIQGTYDERNRRIYWSIKDDSTKLASNRMYVLELRKGISEESSFSTWSFLTQTAASIVFFSNLLHRADHRGFVYKHDGDSMLTDLKLESTGTPATWFKETIIWTYRGVALNFGSSYLRKWVSKILLTAKNRTNVSIQVNAINDDGKSTRALKPIRWRRNFVWGDEDFVWGNPDCVWDSEGLIEQWRWMPARGLRLSYVQIEITNAFVVVENSDLLGLADFSDALNTATLSVAANIWPTQSLDYYIYTEVDNYTNGYKVLSRSDTTLVLEDNGNSLPTGSYKWVLKGYPKGEFLNLLSYVLHTAQTTDNQLTFETGQDGANA